MGSQYQAVRRREGRYFGARVNCESVPCLPAEAIAWVLNDPRKLPYLMVWQDPDTGKIREAARVARYSEPPNQFNLDWTGWVEIRRLDRRPTRFGTIQRPMPRNGGTALLVRCPECRGPKRALYAWEVNHARTHSVHSCRWQCRRCAGLRYSSEGGALVFRSRCTLIRQWEQEFGVERSERPEVWTPYVFSNPADAEWMGVKLTR